MQWLRGLFGSAEPSFEVHMVNMKNRSITEREECVTFCLQAQIEQGPNGSRLGFRMSPVLANVADSAMRNPLASLRDEIKHDSEKYVVLLQVERLRYHNEVPGDLTFVLAHPFEEDPSAEAFRKIRDQAYDFSRQSVVLPVKKPAPLPPKIVNNNNNTTNLLEPATDNEGLDELLGSQRRDAPAGTLEEMDRVAAASVQSGGCNESERNNAIDLGLLRASSTSKEHQVFQAYRASLKEEYIKLYAGQDEVVADLSTLKPANAEANMQLDPVRRAAQPIIESSFLPATHPLVTFIDQCCRDLPERQTGFKLLTSDPSSRRNDDRYYRVSRPLLEEARKLIVIGIFTRMRYTRLSDCHIFRQFETDAGERALVLRIAERFGLKTSGNGANAQVADWLPGAYRPTVTMTLRIRYIVVDGVSATAASLYNCKRVKLVPVPGGQ